MREHLLWVSETGTNLRRVVRTGRVKIISAGVVGSGCPEAFCMPISIVAATDSSGCSASVAASSSASSACTSALVLSRTPAGLLNQGMYSMEFFNRCNITHPDLFSHAFFPRHGGKFLPKEDKKAHKIALIKKLHIRHLRLSKCGPSRSFTSLTRSVANVSAEEGDSSSDGSSGLYFGQATDKEELAALRDSTIRATLMKKLSDANLYGRHGQRQLREKEEALLKCKSELVTMETEMQALVNLAQEVASNGASPGTRKINGKYIQSLLAIRLEELHDCLLQQVKNIEAACYRDVPFVWYGMAEDVQVMGSFDAWTKGLQLSPESTGSFTKFSATVKLRPGWYHVKFLVDGKWHISPDLPSVGEGPNVNNLLVVE